MTSSRKPQKTKYRAAAPIFPTNRTRRFKAVDVMGQVPDISPEVHHHSSGKGGDVYNYASRFAPSEKGASSYGPGESQDPEQVDFFKFFGNGGKQKQQSQQIQSKEIPSGPIVEVLSKPIDDSSFKQPRELPRLIGPYNEYTSFLTDKDIETVFGKLKDVVKKQAEVDYEFVENSYKVRGRKFINHLCCEWQIHFFKKDSAIVVEFQKRTGDPWVFSEFFQTVLNALDKEGVVTETKCFRESNEMKDDEVLTEAGEDESSFLGVEENDSEAMSVASDDDFLLLLPDDFLKPQQNAQIDYDEEFAKDIWDMLVGKDTYHELRQHAAISIAQACGSSSGRVAFQKVDKKCVSILLEEASKCFDAQVVRALLDAVFQFVSDSKDCFNDGTDGKYVKSIQTRWMSTDSKILCSTEINKKVVAIITALA